MIKYFFIALLMTMFVKNMRMI
ncbi:unnamed protein product [Leptidea sinapis]|uniref:Uncharacterized protein n=1 Tax=Leptidea sinapis TaxID=189913 RepID=A0A5E4QYN8_9NEOP|nr:unnamed protein product [Leptidea sinapis]